MKVVVVMGAIFVLLACGCALGGEAKTLQKWQTSHFVENNFREGPSSDVPTVYHRDGFLPFVRSGEKPVTEDRLPQGTGAVVIFCYVQGSDGRAKTHAGEYPLPDAAVQVSDSEIKIILQTDWNGYVVAALPVGKYEISVRGMIRQIVVKERQTQLVPIRAGKRMVN